MLILVAFAAAALAQTETAIDSKMASHETFGLKNGRFWNDADETMKLYFVVGFQNGVFVTRTVPHDDGDMTYRELVKGLDQFYVDAANGRIPVADAIEIFKMKFAGDTPAKIEIEVARIRRKIDAKGRK